MADYKELFGSLMSRARDMVENGGVRGVYEQGVSRTKAYGRIAKLTLERNSQAEELKKVFTEIGKLYFEQARQEPAGFFSPLFAQAESLIAAMDEKEQEIAAVREELHDAAAEQDIDVEITQEPEDFDSVVDATEAAGKGED